MRLSARLGIFEHSQAVSTRSAVIFALIGSVSIGSANVSLLLNSVSFYQISKLLLTPLVCFIEAFLYGKSFSSSAIMSMLVTVLGVLIVVKSSLSPSSYDHASISIHGLVVSVVFLLSSAFQQILTGQYQREYEIQPYQLLSITAPFQALFLCALGPSLDLLISDRWIFTWLVNESTPLVLAVLGVTCIISVGVNLSQFLCLGRFSATSFQVLGHLKTIAILLGGVFMFGERLSNHQVGGMALAVLGMMAYGFVSQPGPPSEKLDATESKGPLLTPLVVGKDEDQDSQTQATTPLMNKV